MRRSLPALAVVGLLALTGCSQGEEPLVLGADGSGDFDRGAKVTATLPPVGGEGPAAGTARAVPAGDGVRVEVRVRGLEPGTWTATLTPGSRCSGAVEEEGAVDLPDLTVDEDGRGLLDATLDDVPLEDLEAGAALTLQGAGSTTCGTLADY
ncbi:hypothetical protein QWY28_01420 [Nocardioides sp. SOB77]|uniref:DUF5666 domain-containing protein n=1 Tax=Nocardioides oceani TaxID=3058369 RepID=A0ABT8FAI5_9ACTN|nr:hypothetical protein [Nocardioides oceani]MDN4171595.1 hypothetical protein [Nocardioides oceani]